MPGHADIFKKAMNQAFSPAVTGGLFRGRELARWIVGNREHQHHIGLQGKPLPLQEEAAAAYRRALEEFPDNAKALSSLGLALLQTQQFDESLQTYRRLAKVSSNDPVAYERIAQLSERLG